jgi:hypothetical protein
VLWNHANIVHRPHGESLPYFRVIGFHNVCRSF